MPSFIFRFSSGSVLVLILLMMRCGDTTKTELECVPSIRVSRYTVWNAPENETLKINCTVIIESHCWKKVSASWCRVNDENGCRPITDSPHRDTEWRIITQNQRMFFLIFWNLSIQDAGLYRCQTQVPVSNSGYPIRVNVTENRDTEQSVVKQSYPLYSVPIAVILVFSISVLIKTIYRKEYSLRDKDTLTTVFYEEAEDSSLQE